MRAVIFDFDGLIIDTETPAFEAWCEIYRENGVELRKEDWVQVVGTTYSRFHPVDHLNELTGKAFDRDKLTAIKEKRKAEICSSMPILPGVLERLEEASELGWRVGLASTSTSDWVESHLRRVDLFKFFPFRITREDVTNVKPHPEPYLKIMKQLGVRPEDSLVLEDSLNGVKAAKSAGAKCVAIPNSITSILDFSEADERYTSLAAFKLAQF